MSVQGIWQEKKEKKMRRTLYRMKNYEICKDNYV